MTKQTSQCIRNVSKLRYLTSVLAGIFQKDLHSTYQFTCQIPGELFPLLTKLPPVCLCFTRSVQKHYRAQHLRVEMKTAIFSLRGSGPLNEFHWLDLRNTPRNCTDGAGLARILHQSCPTQLFICMYMNSNDFYFKRVR